MVRGTRPVNGLPLSTAEAGECFLLLHRCCSTAAAPPLVHRCSTAAPLLQIFHPPELRELVPLDFLKDGFQVELTFYWSSAVRLSVEFGKVTDFLAGEGGHVCVLRREKIEQKCRRVSTVFLQHTYDVVCPSP